MDIRVELSNANEIAKAFSMAPVITGRQIGKAIVAGVFEVEKQAHDGNFMFKTPRSQRTGWLERSFKFGTKIGKEKAEIGPTAKYATFVHSGVRGGDPNPFMVRIANQAEPHVKKHFETAIDNVVKEISKISK